MKERKVIVTCLIVIVIFGVILGGFAYAHINKLNAFNQTKSYLESLGFDISNNVSGVDISTAIKSQFVFPMKMLNPSSSSLDSIMLQLFMRKDLASMLSLFPYILS